MRVFFFPETRKLREDTVLSYKVTIINFSLDVTKNFDTMEYISHIFLNEFFSIYLTNCLPETMENHNNKEHP